MKHTNRRLFRQSVFSLVMALAMGVSVFAASSGVITEDVVNARKGPGTGYDRVEMLARGKQVTILGEESGWYHIQWNDSKGYVLKEYVSTGSGSSSSSQSASPNATVKGGDTVNVRSGPGTEYSRVDIVAEGKRVAVIDQSGSWYKVSFNGQTGYILADYVARDGSSSSSPSSSSSSSDSGNATVTGGDSINVRKGPGTGYDRVTLVKEGQRVTVVDQNGSWYKVSVGGQSGYIFSDFLIRDGSSAPVRANQSGNATVNEEGVNVRSSASTNSSRVTTLSFGKRVTLTEKDGNWYKISFDGRSGYIYGEYVTADSGVLSSIPAAQHSTPAPAPEPEPAPAEEPAQESGEAEPAIPAASAEASSVESGGTDVGESENRAGIIFGGTINVRTGPGTDYDRVTKVSTGKKVNIIGESNGWFKIAFGDSTGYVHSDYVYEGTELPESLSGGVGAQIAAMAPQYLGTRYVYGGESPSGFDCSGFTMYLYRQFGYSLPHSASGQYANCGYKVSRSELQPGDLVFFSSPSSGGAINHVGVYVGGGDVIHARYSVGKVYRNNLSESYYSRYYAGAIRIA